MPLVNDKMLLGRSLDEMAPLTPRTRQAQKYAAPSHPAPGFATLKPEGSATKRPSKKPKEY